ncbi:MAG: GNAT family N-acetyltransferase [Cyanobacteria bacterium J06639_16]
MCSFQTPRLRLVPATAHHIACERDRHLELARLLNCRVPSSWPPTSVRDVLEIFETTLRERPDEVGWHTWYWIARESQPEILVGSGGFKGPPEQADTVEIGYGTLEAFQGRGFATEAVIALTRHALKQPGVFRVIADCHVENAPSLRVLAKCGFKEVGPGGEVGTWRFELKYSWVA